MPEEKETTKTECTTTDTITTKTEDAGKPPMGVFSTIMSTGKDIVNDIDDKIVAILTLGIISVVSLFVLKDPTNIVLTSVGAIGGLALGRRGNGGTSNGNGNGYSNGK